MPFKNRTRPKIVFFGSSDFSVKILNALKNDKFLPNLIITESDKPKGRGLKIFSNPVKEWADLNKISVIQPSKFDDKTTEILGSVGSDLFIVASYGKILPKKVIEIPRKGTLNVHPSLLPKYRGPSPIQTAIINNEKDNGVTIMLLDEKMDHGPIISQEKVVIPNLPVKSKDLGDFLSTAGGKLLLKTIPEWLSGKIKGQPQNESETIYTKKISKDDGLLNLSENPYLNWRKYLAYEGWPGVFIFLDRKGRKIRVKLTDVEFSEGNLKIKKVVPEGKKEMAYEDFLRGLN